MASRRAWVPAILMIVIATQQAGLPRAQLEATSVRRHDSSVAETSNRFSTGRLSIRNTSVRDLVKTAYGVMDFQVSGGPDWFASEKYDIEAKAEGNATPRQMTGPLLQLLLEQRFKLSVRRITRELPVYFLTVSDRSGPNLQRSAEQTCVPFDPANPLLPGAPGRGEICGSIGLGLAGLNGRQITIPALSMALTHLLGRPVIDKTNLTGEFDARMTFAPTGSVDRKSTRLNSSHLGISYAVFCL